MVQQQQVEECGQVLVTPAAPLLSAFVTVAVVPPGRGLVLRRGHSQSVGQLGSRQREQHALHAPQPQERRVRAHQRKRRRSQSKTWRPAGMFVFPHSALTGCIHGNLFPGLNEPHLCLSFFLVLPSCVTLLFEMLLD